MNEAPSFVPSYRFLSKQGAAKGSRGLFGCRQENVSYPVRFTFGFTFPLTSSIPWRSPLASPVRVSSLPFSLT
jgi:hypothetical protein